MFNLPRLLTKKNPEESWPSLVLLLREYQPISDAKLLEIADKCYGMTGSNGRISPELVAGTPAGRLLRVQFFLSTSPKSMADTK